MGTSFVNVMFFSIRMSPKRQTTGVISMFTCPKDGYQDFT